MLMVDPARPMCLRDFMHKKGLRERPRCFYCGDLATTLDHSRPRLHRGTAHLNNLKAACKRCNMRKGIRSRSAFRRKIEELQQAAFGKQRNPVKFYGEGARGAQLKRLRLTLERVTVRRGKVVQVAPGEPLTRPKSQEEIKANRKKRAERPRWYGRFTFSGSRALRALASETGLSFAVIEKFVLGIHLGPASNKALTAAAKKLKLDITVLRALKPVMAR